MKRVWMICFCLIVSLLCSCTQEAAPASASPQESAADLQQYVGGSVQALFDAFGEPLRSEYQDSCAVANAQEGFLYYDGFLAATLKTEDQEIIQYIR